MTAATVSTRAVLAAHIRIWVRSPLGVIPAAAAGYGVLAACLQVATGMSRWDRSLAYLNLWVVMVGPLFVAVLAALIAHTERRARGGALAYRPVEEWRLRLGRIATVGWWCLLTHAGVLSVTAIGGVVAGRVAFGTAVTQAVFVLLVMWLSYLGYCAVLTVAGEMFGIGGCIGIGLMYTIVGVWFAESSSWYWIPPTWIIRPALPLIGTHVNGVGLGTDTIDSGYAAMAFGALGSLIVVGVASTLVGSATSVREVLPALPRISRGHRVVGSVWRSPALALFFVLRRTGVWVLVGLTVAVTVGLARISVDGSYIFFALVVLPLGCALLPSIWIPRLLAGHRAIATRPGAPRALAVRLVVFLLATDLFVCAAAGIGLVIAGLGPVVAFDRMVVAAVVGAMLVLVDAWITTVVGRIAGLLAGIVGTMFGALVGGTSLSDHVGLAFPWAWASYLDTAWLGVTIPVSLAVACIAAVLVARRFDA